jgi:PTH1 family peptidyl-tRNA hydrolase
VAKSDGLGLVVGLGNPGQQYSKTRHNAGFWFVDKLAEQYSASFKFESRFNGDICRVTIGNSAVWLLKPQSFMNASGLSVAACAAYYKIEAGRSLVVHDELALKCGELRLKKGTGHGGHNGLRDITSHFGADFLRARVGIGHPGSGRDVANYVLKAPSKIEQDLIQDSQVRLLVEIESLVDGEFAVASERLAK